MAGPGGYAQDHQVDSLRAILQASESDTVKVNIYNQLAAVVFRSDPLSAIEYGMMARDLAEEVNFQSGLALANAGGRRAVCINHEVGQSSLDARCEGFTNAMTEQGIPVEVLPITKDAAQAQATIAEYHNTYPDADLFLTLGPSGATPFYAFLAAAGLGPDTIRHATFDLTNESAAHLKDGTTLFVIDQQPFLQGYGAVQTLMLKLRYGITPVTPVMPTGPVIVRAGDVELMDDLLGE